MWKRQSNHKGRKYSEATIRNTNIKGVVKDTEDGTAIYCIRI